MNHVSQNIFGNENDSSLGEDSLKSAWLNYVEHLEEFFVANDIVGDATA